MTLQPDAVPDFARFAPFYAPTMLMLGATNSNLPGYATAREYFAQWVGVGYQDLDLDASDLRLDLNTDIGLSRSHRTVFNLGTLEHCWHVSTAYANALRAVEIGGRFLNSSPFRGFESHGIHLTNPDAIRAFVTKNGFEIEDQWVSTWKSGKQVFWLAARKLRHIDDLDAFEPALQVYENGVKRPIC